MCTGHWITKHTHTQTHTLHQDSFYLLYRIFSRGDMYLCAFKCITCVLYMFLIGYGGCICIACSTALCTGQEMWQQVTAYESLNYSFNQFVQKRCFIQERNRYCQGEWSESLNYSLNRFTNLIHSTVLLGDALLLLIPLSFAVLPT